MYGLTCSLHHPWAVIIMRSGIDWSLLTWLSCILSVSFRANQLHNRINARDGKCLVILTLAHTKPPQRYGGVRTYWYLACTHSLLGQYHKCPREVIETVAFVLYKFPLIMNSCIFWWVRSSPYKTVLWIDAIKWTLETYSFMKNRSYTNRLLL